ncbi:fructokinase [Limimaricola soesokkakensis]|uniref:2-dehydro-3-deoxygluconokinase n=1 Tax=Limimaricola soesokkakensis TaxID=1343159 RepID=A0A1X6Y798_9RHOB|nr:carbohydrate kinase [Limimaricola soesokkakensis]PSK87278.1 fructokinase [Limimaricola soesokkakensis]SLN12747.1 2-dehydro-3-deoxygluconokinase [Limimaricola soesokkakensis]
MILACGEALIDMLPRRTEAGETAFAPYAGGAVFNTAIALGRLGAPAGFFSGISSDMFGDILRQTLEASKVDSFPAHISDRPTTLAFVKLTDGHASYSFYDENTAGRMLTEDDLPEPGAEALFFGGISLMVEPCATAYEALQARESATRVTMLDPNIRPSFIRDEAAYRARIERMIARADIVKVSDEDLHWLEGAGDTADLARQMLAKGPKLVCITEGSKGATGYTAEHVVSAAAPKVQVADTVGAGDTFNAGVLASLHRAGLLNKADVATLDEDEIRDALSLGARAAAVTVSRPGANPPWDHEL